MENTFKIHNNHFNLMKSIKWHLKFLKISKKASNHFSNSKEYLSKTYGIKTKISYKNTLSKRDFWKVWITGAQIQNKKILIKTNFQNKKFCKYKIFWIWIKIIVNKLLPCKVKPQMQ